MAQTVISWILYRCAWRCHAASYDCRPRKSASTSTLGPENDQHCTSERLARHVSPASHSSRPGFGRMVAQTAGLTQPLDKALQKALADKQSGPPLQLTLLQCMVRFPKC